MAWMAAATRISDDLQRGARVISGLGGQGDAAKHDKDQPFGLEADLRGPVEQGDRAGPVRAEARPVDGEGGGAGFGALEAAHAEQEVREVANQDEQHRLSEREAERHQHRAVHQVFELHTGAGPHAEQVPGGRPPLAFGDILDAPLLNPERLLGGRRLGKRRRHAGRSGLSTSASPMATSSAARPT